MANGTKHDWMQNYGALIGAVAIIVTVIWQLGHRDAAIETNRVAIERIEASNKEGFDKLGAAIQELKDSEANKEIAVLKVQVENEKMRMDEIAASINKRIDEIHAEIKEHDHNGIYIRKEDYRPGGAGSVSQ